MLEGRSAHGDRTLTAILMDVLMQFVFFHIFWQIAMPRESDPRRNMFSVFGLFVELNEILLSRFLR